MSSTKPKKNPKLISIFVQVIEYGSVDTSINVIKSFNNYEGGVFQGCLTKKSGHSVVVVG